MRARSLIPAWLLVAASASPDALAAKSKLQAAASAGASPASTVAILGFLTVLSLALLALGAFAAHRSTRARAKKPPKKSFDAGRRLGRAEGAQSTADAAARIEKGRDVLKEARAGPFAGGLRVIGQPKRGRPCEFVAGYLTGLTEVAWSSDVAVRHDACGARAGQPCTFDVARVSAGPRVSASANPRAGSRIPGS